MKTIENGESLDLKNEKIISIVIGIIFLFISLSYFLLKYQIYYFSFIPFTNNLFIALLSFIGAIMTFTKFEYEILKFNLTYNSDWILNKLDIYLSIILMIQGLFNITIYFLNDFSKFIYVSNTLYYTIIGIAALNFLVGYFLK